MKTKYPQTVKNEKQDKGRPFKCSPLAEENVLNSSQDFGRSKI
jgi:hypothetical protein